MHISKRESRRFVMVVAAGAALFAGMAPLAIAGAQPHTNQRSQPMVTTGGPTCVQASTGLPPLPSGVVLPTLPQVCNVPVYPVPTAGTLAAHTAADLQNALNTVTCGQEIVLDAGVSYLGNFWMPGKSCSGSILVRSTAIQSLAPNVVPTWAQRKYMARVSTPNALQVLLDAFTHDGSAAGTGVKWYWAGIELTAEPGVTFWDLIQFGGAEPPYPTPDQILYGITFDRCLVHGNDQMSARGFAAEAAGFALINSRVWGFNNSYQDTQAVGACNGPGPYLISNNVLESTGENVMFGGCSALSIPSDITVTRNHFLKDLSWNGWLPPGATQQYDVKNEFEIKNGQRVLVDSNYFENTFGSAQNEFTIINCGVNEGLQTCFDITYTNNVFAHGPQVFVFGGNSAYLTEQRVLFRNNLAYDINGTTFTGPGMFGRLDVTKNTTVDHNTCINQPSNNNLAGISFADNPPSSNMGLTYTNNIIYASMTANGMDPLQVVQNFPADANVSYDVFVGDAWPNSWMGAYPALDHLWSPNSTATPVANQPSCNQLNKPIVQCWPLDLSLVGFAGPDTNGNLTLSGFALAPLSPYYRAGSDGNDVGANLPAVLAAVANVPH